VRIATYNVNGINARLPVLVKWLSESQPDIVCLQELKAVEERFPALAIQAAGYEAIWHGQKSWNGVAILTLARRPEEIIRGLPGDPLDPHSRCIEARIEQLVVGCLYLPNGNPAPGPKFDYKLRWLEYFRQDFTRDRGLRIDHILLSPVLKNLLAAAQVDRFVRGWERTSDHAPVWVDIDLPPQPALGRVS
jgi:exodeoxyribonuclease III